MPIKNKRFYVVFTGMIILHVSDIHGSESVVKRLVERIRDFEFDVIVVSGDFEEPDVLDRLAELGKPVYAVIGNMDPPWIKRHVEKYLIEHKYVDLGEFYLVGYPFRKEDVPRDKPLIILSHYPPYGTRVDVAWSGEHIGSATLRNLVEELKPIAVLCGHVHESPGIDYIGNTVIVNAGPLYRGSYAVVKVEEGRVKNVEIRRL